MNTNAIRQQIETYGQGHAVLCASLRRFPMKMWLYRPGTGQWSIHETIVHLANAEAEAYVDCRRFIAEPGCWIREIPRARWTGALGYWNQSARRSLKLFQHLRRLSYELLLTMPESVWSNQVEHPADGTLRLEDWLNVQLGQIPHYLAQMSSTHEQWVASRAPIATTASNSLFRRPRMKRAARVPGMETAHINSAV